MNEFSNGIKVVDRFVETEDEFILEQITPFAEKVSKRHISKEDLKKALDRYYSPNSLTGNEYQKLAMRTNDGKCMQRLVEKVYKLDTYGHIDLGELFDACLGLSGEVGELHDLIKKWIFHEQTLDITHLKKELGDVMWYVAMFCHAMGWSLDEILNMNIEKLKNRYPEGFDVYRANHREEGDI